MSGGGGDEKRSAFTSRVLVVTEADKLDAVGAGSDEGTKLRQLEGRTRFYGNRKRVYLECTVSEEDGCIWQEFLAGSSGLVHQPCHSCGEYVASGTRAPCQLGQCSGRTRRLKTRHSPAQHVALCGVKKTGTDNYCSLALCIGIKLLTRQARSVASCPELAHVGSGIPLSANSFADVAMIGVEEWRAKRAVDEELAERELMQWTWAWPPAARKKVEEPLEVSTLMQRQSELSRGTIPHDVTTISAGVDARKQKLEWFVIAERESGGPLCIDYGWQDVPFGQMALSKALQAAVADLQERFDYGWKLQDSEETRSADIVLLDCHWETDALYEACSWHQSWMPALGFGYQQHKATYHAPRRRGEAAPIPGDAWHVVVMSRAS